MYAKRIQIVDCGPIDHVDITLPFNGDNPKPVLLVGENGSGKSIVLSHIVNGLMSAQETIYPANSEVEKGKVYKFQHPLYIKVGSEYYWTKIDFEQELHCEELQLNRPKNKFPQRPVHLVDLDMVRLWDNFIPSQETSNYKHNLHDKKQSIKDIFNTNCILYFPPNRFEEPAWLNEQNLRAKAEHMTLKNIKGYTNRKIINYSPLRGNQNWLFGVLSDSFIFEKEYQGSATEIYDAVLDIVRQVFGADGNLQFGIGGRRDRRVFLTQNDKTLVHNIFQLSSGETSLLNLFLSILRDFDLSRTPFAKVEYVRGIVVVDEIDLHLHAIHQHEILPKLIQMFPRVQFIVTTHSPLFVLGMENTFGKDGFALYRLPQGEQIGTEEFSEFESAYKYYKATEKFSNEIKNALKPVIFVEGTTDVKYLRRAAELLGSENIFQKVELKDGGGFGNLSKIFSSFNLKLSEIIPQKVILLYDCDKPHSEAKGKMHRLNILKKENHPLKEGIENLFEKATLEKARGYKPMFIIVPEYLLDDRGKKTSIPERWKINKDEKTNLCDWLCENGTAEDFKHFRAIFDLLEEILNDSQEAGTSESQGRSSQ